MSVILRGFSRGPRLFDPFGVKISAYGATIRPNFFVLSFYGFLIFSSCYSLLILLSLYLNCLNSFCLFLFIILCPQTPVLPIAASQILSANNIKKKPRRKYNVPRPSHCNGSGVINEKTPRIVPVWQKIRQSIPQLK
jgi:hypothetical protein